MTEIGLSAFDGCTSVHFIVNARNEFYCSESGALFDKEKKTLISGYALVRDGLCNIPESVTKIDGSIYGGAFSGCESLEEVYIPAFVTEIGEFAFSWCTSLKQVHIPDSVTEIGEHAFSYCNSVYFIVDPNNKHFYSKSGKLCRC